ncbi:MAG: phosphoglucosamine mutase [Acidobacteria bacterium]|nr:phosphoglucosamine mutase [Acidobacteriota bacterium]
MGSLFGTDGVRGVAGRFPLDRRTLFHLGEQLVRLLRERGAAGKVLIGRDTRASGIWIQGALVEGVRGGGGSASLTGVLPTPAVCYLTRHHGFDAGIVISASHNPYQDNGIKVVAATGTKLAEGEETTLEAWLQPLLDPQAVDRPTAASGEQLLDSDGQFFTSYVQFLINSVGNLDLSRLKMVVDCANGASYRVAPFVLEKLGTAVVPVHAAPDGVNINLNCGSLHPEALQRKVVEEGADLGVAYDGDADRSLFVDHRGNLVDGDHILYIFARELQRQGRLRKNAVVGTVMSNVGLEVALRQWDIELLRTAVGDRYVAEEMLRREVAIGGEQSGHIILLDYAATGDGLLTTLKLLELLRQSGATLYELARDLPKYPQVLLNVRVREKVPFEQVPALADAIEKARERLGNSSRLLVRYSGTEPVARVMTEGPDADQVQREARLLAGLIREHLGTSQE